MKAQFLHQAQQKKGDPLLGALGQIAGTAIGTAIGGPTGGAIGGSIGGQLGSTGTIDPATTLQGAAGQAISSQLTDGIKGVFNKDVSILDDPLKGNVAVTTETMSAVPQAPQAPQLQGVNQVAPDMINNKANPLAMAAAPLTAQAFAGNIKPEQLALGMAANKGGLGQLMKGIFG